MSAAAARGGGPVAAARLGVRFSTGEGQVVDGEAEDEWQYQQDLARYQTELTVWAIARTQQTGYHDARW